MKSDFTHNTQRSCYSCSPYTEGFSYALKIRETNNSTEPENPYEIQTLEWYAFSDGFRDGSITNLFHGLTAT